RSAAAARCPCASTTRARRWGRASSGSSSTCPRACCRSRPTTGRAESMITREQEGGVLTLMLNRPEVGNALSPEIVTGMEEALAVATSDASVRVVVVTGAGKHFSAGADLNYMKSMRGAGHEANVADALRTQRLFAGLAELPKPVVARVHGASRGGGAGL